MLEKTRSWILLEALMELLPLLKLISMAITFFHIQNNPILDNIEVKIEALALSQSSWLIFISINF